MTAKKGGLSFYHIVGIGGAVRVSSTNISDLITISVLRPSWNNSKVKYYIFIIENSSFMVDF